MPKPISLGLNSTKYRMTKSIQQIQQELDDIELTVGETAVEFQAKYRNYLNLLSQSVQQQLILASYQICTQFYPQAFLQLSLSNKQELQQTLRQIAQQVQPILLRIIEEQELEPELSELNLMAELIKNLPTSKRPDKTPEETPEKFESIDLESVKAELANLENVEFIEIDASDGSELVDLPLETPLKPPTKQPVELNNPEHLILWHRQIERKIKFNLERTSKKVNQCLQNCQIIPHRIPTKIIDVAIQTDGNKGAKNNRKVSNTPNVMHLAIETEPGNKKSNSNQNITQISLLRLRLAEIEFADPILNAQRGQIRNLISQISKLKSKYQVTKHQSEVAEAQAAWRSSWYED